MKKIYLKSLSFWFVLLVVALINASIREMWYKPVLTPYIENWAHQISSLTGIIFFFLAIYYFFKKTTDTCDEKDALSIGVLWLSMTILFETWMNVFIRKLTVFQVLETYYFWNGETWIFVLLSLVISPLIVCNMLKKRKSS